MKATLLTSTLVLLVSSTALGQEVVRVAPEAKAGAPTPGDAPKTEPKAKGKKDKTADAPASGSKAAPGTAVAPGSDAAAAAKTQSPAQSSGPASSAPSTNETSSSPTPGASPSSATSSTPASASAAKPEAAGAATDSTRASGASAAGSESVGTSDDASNAAKADAKKKKKRKSKKRGKRLESDENNGEEEVTEVPSASAPPSPPPPPPVPEVDPETRALTHYLNRWELSLGGSVLWTSSTALDYFATNNVLGRFEARVARTFALGERLSFGLSPSWNVIGAADDGVRSNNSSMRMSEFSLGLELRYFLSTRLSGSLRLSPGGTHTQAEISTGAATLKHESFDLHGDLSAAVAWRMFGEANGEKPGLRLFWTIEGGYDWMPSRQITLSAASGSPERTQSLKIDAFEISAPHVGSSLLLTY